jgi:hypothetical protein
MNFRPSLLLLLWLSVSWVYAKEGDKEQKDPPPPPPSLEMLEFLGSWDNGHGEWVDPTEFADDSFEQLAADYDGKKK